MSVQRPLVSFNPDQEITAPEIKVDNKIISKGDAKTRLIWQGVKTNNYNFAAVENEKALGIFDRERNWIAVKIDNQRVLGNINSISKRFGIKPEQIQRYSAEELGSLLKLIAADAIPDAHAMNLESESYVKDPLNLKNDKVIFDKDEEKVFKQLVQEISDKVIPGDTLIYPSEKAKLQENVAKILYHRKSQSDNPLAKFVIAKAFVRDQEKTEERLGKSFYEAVKNALSEKDTLADRNWLIDQTKAAFKQTQSITSLFDIGTAANWFNRKSQATLEAEVEDDQAMKEVQAMRAFTEALKEATQLARIAEGKRDHDETPPSDVTVNLFLYVVLSKTINNLEPPKFAKLALDLGLVDYVKDKNKTGFF